MGKKNGKENGTQQLMTSPEIKQQQYVIYESNYSGYFCRNIYYSKLSTE